MLYLTNEFPGTAGRIKGHPDDFRVTEIPLYLPSGEGDHVYLYIEKSGLGSLEAADRIARALGRPRQAVGVAGLKDAQAVTQQWMSVERADPDLAARLNLPGIKILEVSRHRNKLKIGHLVGNRFEVRVRGCRPHARETAERVLAVLAKRGVPNWFDRQRFGSRGDNHILGRAIVMGQAKEFCDQFLGRPTEKFDSPRLAAARCAYDEGEYDMAKQFFTGCADHLRVLWRLAKTRSPSRALQALPKQLTRLFVGAFQSDLFNAVLERRLDSLDRVEAGDLAYIHPRIAADGHVEHGEGPAAGAVFRVERPEDEQPRADRFEISPTGPILGHRMTTPEGRPGEIEQAVMAEKTITANDFDRVKALRLRGERRPLRIPLTQVEVEPVEDDIRVRFVLPSGGYATVVLREIMKADV